MIQLINFFMNSNNELNPLVDIIIPNYNKGIFIDDL